MSDGILKHSKSAAIRPWRDQKQRRVNLALDDFTYRVVIAENARGFDLVTAYTIERGRKREKLKPRV